VVPGRDRDHAARLLLVGELRELVQRAARLEGARLLEELGLEVDLGASGPLAQRLRAEGRRAVNSAGDPTASGLDVGELEDHVSL
jgi:hypothetical protein